MLSAVYRDGAGHDFPETVVTLDKTTGAVALGPTRAEADDQAMGDAIAAFLKTLTEPVDQQVIRDNVEGDTAPKVKALRRLVDARRVIRTGTGKKGAPYLYALMVPPDPGSDPGGAAMKAPRYDSGLLVWIYMFRLADQNPKSAPSARSDCTDAGLQHFAFSDVGLRSKSESA